jgi:hypothetical protein
LIDCPLNYFVLLLGDVPKNGFLDKKNPLQGGISAISYKLGAKENVHFQFSIEPSKNQGWFFMQVKDKKVTATQLPNGSQNNANELQDDRKINEKFKVVDQRDHGFFVIDNLFVDLHFDVYTMAYYMLIVRRAHRSKQGFFELQSTTCETLGISESKLKQCNALLEFCNIIKIKRRKDPKKPKIQISSLITLIDQSKWKLNHPFRDAGSFYQSKKKSMSEDLKQKILEVKQKNRASKSVDIVDNKEDVSGGGLPQNPPWVTTKPTVGYQITPYNKEPIEERTQLTNGGEKNLSFELPNETPPPKEKNRNFKKSYKNELSEDELNKKQIISYARDSHKHGVMTGLFEFFEYDLIDKTLSSFIEKYPFKLIQNFYMYAIEMNRPIDIRITEKAFLKWQKLEAAPAEESPAEELPAEELPAEESPAEESPAEESPAEESPAEESPAEESNENLFNELSIEVKTYLNTLTKLQFKHQLKDLQNIGVQKYEEYILNLLDSKIRKNKYNKAKIQDNFNKYSTIGG